MNQNQIFATVDDDAWFNRNLSQLQTFQQIKTCPDVRYFLDSLTPFQDRIERVLEIGCSNGIKLQSICHEINAVGVGVDSSTSAVLSGNQRKKIADITLKVGTGESLSYQDQSFDIVYFAFCLYLFDRNKLMESLAEADRVLKPGVFLVVTDFDPSLHYKKTYSHFKCVFLYKQDYASFYIQSRLYYLVGKHSFSHRFSFFDELPDQRVSTSFLFKEVYPYQGMFL